MRGSDKKKGTAIVGSSKLNVPMLNDLVWFYILPVIVADFGAINGKKSLTYVYVSESSKI